MRTTAILLLVTTMRVTAELPYNNVKLGNTGVIFEDIGKTLVFKDHWTIFTTINMTRITLWKHYIQWSETTMRETCNHFLAMQIDHTCTHNLKNLEYITKRINKTLAKVEMNVNSRKRRSIFDGIGKLTKFLFGTMDQEDADEIHLRLNNLETDNKQNLDLLKEQVSLIKSNYESNQQNFEQLESHLIDIRENTMHIVNTFNSSINKAISEINILKHKMVIDETTTNLIVALHEIEEQINDLKIILSSLSDNRLHPLILSYQQIAGIVGEAPVTYPLNKIISNTFLMQQLATVESVHSHETIFCKIAVPLLQKEWFSLKKVYALPIPSKTKIFVHYDVSHDYLLTNEGASRFIPLHEHDLRFCKTISFNITTKIFVCQTVLPIFASPDDQCLLLLYKGWPEANKQCTTVPTLQGQNTLIKMVTENSWLYLLSEKITLKIECSEFHTILKLTDRGMLNLKPNCEAKAGNLVLTTSNIFIKNISFEQSDLMPMLKEETNTYDIPFTLPENVSTGIQLINHEKQATSLKANKYKLDTLMKNINTFQNEREMRSKTNIQTTHTISLTTLAVLFILITLTAIFVIVRWKRQLRNSQHRITHTTPNKRQEILLETKFSTDIAPEANAGELTDRSSNLTTQTSTANNQAKPCTSSTTTYMIPEENKGKICVSDFEIV